MLRKNGVLFLTILLVLINAGCGSTGSSGPVAIVDGEEVSRSVYDRELDYMLTSYQMQGYELTDEDRDYIKQNVVDTLINNILLRNAAIKAGFTPESFEAEIEAELVEVKGNFTDEEEFLAALEESGYSLDEYREYITDYYIIECLYEQELDTEMVEVAEDEVQEMVDLYLEMYGEEDLDVEELRSYFSESILQKKIDELRMEFIDGLREKSEIEYLDY